MNSEQDVDLINELALISASRTGAFPAPNTSLFRYVGMRDPRSWQMLENTVLQNKIPLTTSVSFNDPFDSNPVVVSNLSFAEIGDVLGGLPSKVVNEEGRLVLDTELEKRVVKVISESFVRTSSPKVASFCRRISSQLLWAHYANSYKGLVYHFAPSGSPGSALHHIYPVEYERQRPIILASEMLDILRPPGEDKFGVIYRLRAFERKAYLTKSVEWSYEEEERLLVRVGEASFDPHELVAIIIGPHFSDEDLKKLTSIVAKRSRPLRIYRARLADSDYAIEIDWAHPM
jgi:hypothetical protein